MKHSNLKTWFITGASKGLGLALATKLLKEGYAVAATSRNAKNFSETLLQDKNFLALQTDLSDENSIRNAAAQTVKHFGKIDVVVNNAGYGIGGAIEELSENEISQSFDVNVFATLKVIKAVMPYLRAQRSGHIINISSIAGFAAATGWAVYAAVKFAVVGLSEVLAEDVKEFGIHVTVVEPGAFRTQFLTPESLVLAQNPIEDYTAIRKSHERYASFDGAQIGDPEKAASVFIDLVKNPNPPIRLFLGSDAYKRATEKVQILHDDLQNWKAVSISTDFN